MTKSDTRADLFTALQTLSGIVPEMRTGQLMAALGELCTDLHGRGLWDATDAELLEAMWQFRRNYEAAAISGKCHESWWKICSRSPSIRLSGQGPGSSQPSASRFGDALGPQVQKISPKG